MKLRRIFAIFKKQILDTSQNTGVIFSFVVFPLMTLMLILLNSNSSEIYRMHIVMSMSTIFIGMTPFTTINGIIREDKFSNVTRMLILSTVKPLEYLLGVTLYIMAISSVIAIVFGLIGGFVGISLLWYVLAIMLGTFTSLVFGSMLTIQTKNPSGAATVVSLIAIFNGIIPTFASSSPVLMKVARFWYTTQLQDLIGDVSGCYYGNIPYRLFIIGANLAVFLILFTVLFRKNRIIVK